MCAVSVTNVNKQMHRITSRIVATTSAICVMPCTVLVIEANDQTHIQKTLKTGVYCVGQVVCLVHVVNTNEQARKQNKPPEIVYHL